MVEDSATRNEIAENFRTFMRKNLLKHSFFTKGTLHEK